jgi:hypothetical protein
VPLKTTISPVIPALQSELPTSVELWRRRGDEPSDSVAAAIRLRIPPALVSDSFSAGFCNSRHEGRPLTKEGSLPVCLSLCVQRATLKTPPPFGRTLSFPKSASRLHEVRTPAPKQAVVPFRKTIQSPREWASPQEREYTYVDAVMMLRAKSLSSRG